METSVVVITASPAHDAANVGVTTVLVAYAALFAAAALATSVRRDVA